MRISIITFTALLPITVLIYYIYHKDKNSPEPTGQLIKAFFLGVLSCPLSFCLSVPFLWIGLYSEEMTSVLDSVRTSFFGAAIPEECAKLFVLWLLLKKNKFFDESMDGIVYAVCVSLGFAAIENVMYLFGNSEEWMSVGIARALFSVPGHFGFGILMGYYYSLAKFSSCNQRKNRILVLVAPILAHGIFDSILFTIQVAPLVAGILFILFLVFCHTLWKEGHKRIAEHLKRDSNAWTRAD